MKSLIKIGIVAMMILINNEVVSWLLLTVLVGMFIAKLAKEVTKND